MQPLSLFVLGKPFAAPVAFQLPEGFEQFWAEEGGVGHRSGLGCPKFSLPHFVTNNGAGSVTTFAAGA
jgi:hypothetical protein